MRIEVVGSTSLSSQLEEKTDDWESCCFLFSPHEDVENGELGDWDLVHEPGDQIMGLKSPMEVTLTPVFAPADHGEGRGREVELGPGEAGDAAKWDGTQVHLPRKVSPCPEYLIIFRLPSNRFSLKVPFHRRVEAW